MSASYSFVSKKDSLKKLELLQTETDGASSTEAAPAVSFKIVKGSMTANNKFYWSFGEKPPFSFNKCYPINAKTSKLIENHELSAEGYVHPVVWGIAEVTSTTIEGVEVGSQYMAMLPIGESVSFAKAEVQGDGNIVVDRPSTFAAYNNFVKIDTDNAMASSEYSDLALACMPGIVTGYGLYFRMLQYNCYGADNIVVTSASSKVALAMALYMKNDSDKKFKDKKIIGYTSSSNIEFCKRTGLYDTVLSYDEVLPSQEYVMIDIAGRGNVYTKNEKESGVDILKLLVIGNSSGTDNKKATFSTFSYFAMIKMGLAMCGLPAWVHSWMKPTQELYLIWEDNSVMEKEWGKEKYKKIQKDISFTFCKSAKEWMKVRLAMTEEEIMNAFEDILAGTVPPSEVITLDAVKALAHHH